MTQNQPNKPDGPLQPENLNPIVYRILHEADPELAGYYLGAHKTLEDTSNPEREPCAAHSLRELIEKLPDKHTRGVKIEGRPGILSSPIYEARNAWKLILVDKNQKIWRLPDTNESSNFLKKSEKFWAWFDKHYSQRSEQIVGLMEGVDRGVPLPTALQERRLKQWKEFKNKFTKISHHGEKLENFHEFLDEFEKFLIRELEPQTTKDFARISTLIEEIEAGDEGNITELMHLVHANRPNYDHFFFNISASKWLKILEDNHLTNHVDSLVQTDEGEYMSPAWTPGQYYEKIAELKPGKVASIITSLPETDNTRVHEQIVDIAKKMPKEQAIHVLPLISEWLKNRFTSSAGLLPFKVGEYIVELANKKAYDEAIEAFRALFELQPPNESGTFFRHPETLTSDTSYKTILKDTVPVLMELDAESTIKELCDLLESGLTIENQHENDTETDGIIYDGSFIWRPDIRESKIDHEPNEILVSQLYVSISNYIKTAEQKLSVVRILTSYRHEVFHRIAATIAEGETSPELKKVYEEFVDRSGEPNREDVVVSESTVVPAISVDDMRKKSSEGLIKLLNEWDPKEDFPGFGRSKSDVGDVLSQYTRENPELLKQLLESEEKLNTEYYGYLFRGIRLASDNKNAAINWEYVLESGKAFIEATNTTESEGDERRAQFELINAVESGINNDHIEVKNSKIADNILAIFSPLCSHVEPSVEDEVNRDKDSSFDLVTLSINTMRSEALSGLIALLKNVARNNHGQNKNGKPLTKGQSDNVYKLLKNRLDFKAEPTQAVRTVHARELPFLAHDNKEWVEQNLDKIFPRNSDQERYFINAVEAFLIFTKPFPEVFPLVSPYVIEYMKRVQQGQIKNSNDSVINHLVGQTLLLYIDGFVNLDDPIMQELFNMPDSYLEEAMDFFGRGIKNVPEERQELILKKAKDYWQKRLDSGEAKKAEYSKFGWWLRASTTDDWIKEHFLKALHETDRMDELYFVADEVAELANTNETIAANFLFEIVDTQHRDNLIHMLHTPELRDTLQSLLTSKDTDIKDKAERVIDKLCHMGFYNFKDLVE